MPPAGLPAASDRYCCSDDGRHDRRGSQALRRAVPTLPERPRRVLARGRRAPRLDAATGTRGRAPRRFELRLVCGRPHEPLVQRARSPRRGRSGRRPGADWPGRARWATCVDICRAARSGRASRRRPSQPGDRQGRPRDDLHAHVGRSNRRDAGDGPDRGNPLRRLRRLRSRRAGRPNAGEWLAPAVDHRRHLPQGQGHRPPLDRRRRDRLWTQRYRARRGSEEERRVTSAT